MLLSIVTGESSCSEIVSEVRSNGEGRLTSQIQDSSLRKRSLDEIDDIVVLRTSRISFSAAREKKETHLVTDSVQSSRYVQSDQESSDSVVQEHSNVGISYSRGVDSIWLETVEDFGSFPVSIRCGRSGEVEDGRSGQSDGDSVL